MKTLKNILTIAFIALIAVSCNDGIDGITQVDPGADASAPVIKINRPLDGTQIKVPEATASITIDFEVTDDIEIGSISVQLDGTEINNYTEFKDYRRFLIKDIVYDNVTTGSHTLTIEAIDLDGKSSSSSVTFEKVPPYVPMYDGEKFYMPFDGDFNELVTITPATEVGTPGFAGESVLGTNAYKGATDSYLTFPTNGLLNTNEFSGAFWYKVSGDPDRAGILVIGADENRTQGLRLFREGSATEQRIKLNVGYGSGESWNDGGVIDVTAGEWVHIAFTISETQTIIYLNGVPVNTGTMAGPIDWTGCDKITIGSGGETFSYWGHTYDNSPMDELRLFDKALSATEIQNMINDADLKFYMPFDGNSYKDVITGTDATEVGSPGFSTGKEGEAYAGATDAYLTYPADGLTDTNEFTAVFWYKVNPDPDRAGILVLGADENRTQGFRLFREGNATEQRIKLNVGFGTGESWNDGGIIDATTGEWVQIAFTISETETIIYINGVAVNTSPMGAAVDWTGCNTLTIGAGGDTFSYWGHLSDNSNIDGLRIYNKALSQSDIVAMM